MKIEIVEDKSEPITTRNGKKHKRGKVSLVVPSMNYIISSLMLYKIKRLYRKF